VSGCVHHWKLPDQGEHETPGVLTQTCKRCGETKDVQPWRLEGKAYTDPDVTRAHEKRMKGWKAGLPLGSATRADEKLIVPTNDQVTEANAVIREMVTREKPRPGRARVATSKAGQIRAHIEAEWPDGVIPRGALKEVAERFDAPLSHVSKARKQLGARTDRTLPPPKRLGESTMSPEEEAAWMERMGGTRAAEMVAFHRRAG
jgi:hypothetical protein